MMLRTLGFSSTPAFVQKYGAARRTFGLSSTLSIRSKDRWAARAERLFPTPKHRCRARRGSPEWISTGRCPSR
jgi:hypothetical protein